MSWGANLSGYSETLDLFDGLEMQFGDDTVYVVGTDKEYGPYVELGTSNMAAQPHLFPAARSVARRVDTIARGKDSQEAIIKSVALEIEREVKERSPVDTGALRASYAAQKIE